MIPGHSKKEKTPIPINLSNSFSHTKILTNPFYFIKHPPKKIRYKFKLNLNDHLFTLSLQQIWRWFMFRYLFGCVLALFSALNGVTLKLQDHTNIPEPIYVAVIGYSL